MSDHRAKLREDILTPYRRACAKIIRFPDRDKFVFEYIACIAVAMKLKRGQEPIWGYLTGPPAGGKTEAFRPLMNWDAHVIPADDLTKNSMMSAYDQDGIRSKAKREGAEDNSINPSLLPRLDRKLLLIKDLTGMLVREDACDALMGVLRGAYDGSYTKHSGTLGRDDAKPEFGILAAVTDDGADQMLSRDQTLGERFISLKVQQGSASVKDAVSLGLHIMQVRSRGKRRHRKRLADLGRSLLERGISQVKQGHVSHNRPGMAQKVETIIRLALLLAMLRSQPGSVVPVAHERPNRLMQVFAGLCDVHARLSGRSRWSTRSLDMIRKIVFDTIPTRNMLVLSPLVIAERKGNRLGLSIEDLRSYTSLLAKPLARQMGEFTHCGVARYLGDGKYRISSGMYKEIVELGMLERFVR